MNPPRSKTFWSYWQASYEDADQINDAGLSLSMNDATRYTYLAYDDHSQLQDSGIKTVRESVGWRLIEKDARFDFSSIQLRARAARKLGLQVTWALCHYGWPDHVDVYSPDFVDRPSGYCASSYIVSQLKPHPSFQELQ